MKKNEDYKKFDFVTPHGLFSIYADTSGGAHDCKNITLKIPVGEYTFEQSITMDDTMLGAHLIRTMPREFGVIVLRAALMEARAETGELPECRIPNECIDPLWVFGNVNEEFRKSKEREKSIPGYKWGFRLREISQLN